MELVRHVLTHPDARLGALIVNSKGRVVFQDASARHILKEDLRNRAVAESRSLEPEVQAHINRFYGMRYGYILKPRAPEPLETVTRNNLYAVLPLSEFQRLSRGKTSSWDKRFMVLISPRMDGKRRELSEPSVKRLVELFDRFDRKDPETKAHELRVLGYGNAVAEALRFSEADRYRARLGLLLHDLGKLRTPDKILFKKSGLTPEEYYVMAEHMPAGLEFLKSAGLRGSKFKSLHDTVFFHNSPHYAIPEAARGTDDEPNAVAITKVADTFDALTSNRPYRPAYYLNAALQIMQNGFDRNEYHKKAYNKFMDILGLTPKLRQMAAKTAKRERERKQKAARAGKR